MRYTHIFTHLLAMLNLGQISPNTPVLEADVIKDAILRHCIYNGNQMIPQMAASLGYSVPTVAKYVGELLSEGFFVECGKMDSHRGRKPIVYGVNPAACYFVGVDIARFALNIGLMNVVGEIVCESRIEDFCFENTPATLDRVCQSVVDFWQSRAWISTRLYW